MRVLVCVLALGAALLPAPPVVAQTFPFCQSAQRPEFLFGFAALKALLGERMGAPLECEHANPDNGDSLQQTSTGLAFYRKATNTPSFTNGFEHWALTAEGLAYWTGPNPDPPGQDLSSAPPEPPASGPASPSGPPPDPPASPPSPLARVLELTNLERQQAGLAPLAFHPSLQQAAQAYAEVLASSDCFAHTCGPVPEFTRRATQAGYHGWSALAENIAFGQPTPEAVVSAWMRSPGHRANILSPKVKEVGVGMASGGRRGLFWVQVFGARRS